MAVSKSSNDEANSTSEPLPEQVSTEAAPEEVVGPEVDNEQAADQPEPTNIVRYTGRVTERHITKEDWEQAGVSDQDGVSWVRDVNDTVTIDQFTEEALQVLANTGEFEIIRDVKD